MMLIIGWQVYDIARDSGMSMSEAAAQLGLIGLIQFVPLFALTPSPAGSPTGSTGATSPARPRAADRRRRAARLGDLVRHEQPPILFTVAFLLGIARAFSGPALGALAPNLVPREILPKAIALSSISWQAGMVAGPGLGGYLYAWRPEASLSARARLFCVALLCLFLIGPVPRPEVDRNRHPIRQMIDGLPTSAPTAWCSGAITLDLFAVLLAGATALLPIYARDILKVGTEGPRPARRRPGASARRSPPSSSPSGR
jgi:MFS family permease